MSTSDPPPGPRRPPNTPSERPGPAGGARDRNRRAKAEALRQAALDLFVAEGVGGVSIQAVAARAGVAKGSVYRYFPSKVALVADLIAPLHAAVDGALDRCEEALHAATGDDDAARAYQVVGLAVAQAVLSRPALLQLVLQESRGPGSTDAAPLRDLEAHLAERAVALTEIAHARGLLRPMPARVSALAVLGAAERLAYEALRGDTLPSPAAVVQDLVTLVMDGLRPP